MIDLRRTFRRPPSGRVSVVIPLYNHAAYVAAAVRSVLDQGPILRELIVVDDGSTDGSAEAMRVLCRDDPRIVFWSQDNRGALAALNAGLLRAGGEFVAVLNSDDCYQPGRLQALAEALDRDAGAALAASLPSVSWTPRATRWPMRGTSRRGNSSVTAATWHCRWCRVTC